MAYYGFAHRYGSNMRDEDSDRIGTLHIFTSRADRDAWIEGGNEYVNNPGAREAVRSKFAARWQRVSGNVIEGAG